MDSRYGLSILDSDLYSSSAALFIICLLSLGVDISILHDFHARCGCLGTLSFLPSPSFYSNRLCPLFFSHGLGSASRFDSTFLDTYVYVVLWFCSVVYIISFRRMVSMFLLCLSCMTFMGIVGIVVIVVVYSFLPSLCLFATGFACFLGLWDALLALVIFYGGEISPF